MSNPKPEDDLLPTETEGYRVGEKKTVEELQQLDAHDESLQKWKESLGLGKVAGPADDPRKVVVMQLALEVDGRPDVVLDLTSPESIKAFEDKSVVIKEDIEYRLKIKFKVQHEVISGLKYIQVIKRMGVKVDKQEEMLGSYGPSEEPYEKTFPSEQSPSGMLYRGIYQVKSRFIDDDLNVHLEWPWQFEIKKNWD
ncbi:rho GDP dissociation inhibitor [Entomophthora muscae]|uniref:Rho GDP dissociation inhibitor n=2 Tax=Entomophthora muscae TaxID=34485 RepID=A0ACC2SY73_9FUNG|nr:rho GDP dissociation inhibitor [Entomophthora muscae]KAJ9087788.1 rho GDP dissociation inhibitor [Entomophthora muscae]